MPADHSLTPVADAGQLSPFLQEFAASRLKSSLQITSVCGNRCLFCSNRFNPFQLPRQEHRSLAQQTLVVLERGLGLAEDPRNRRRRIIRSVREAPVEGAEALPRPAELVREDRDR